MIFYFSNNTLQIKSCNTLTKKTAKKARKHSSSSKHHPKSLMVPQNSYKLSSHFSTLRSTADLYEIGPTETILKRKRIKDEDEDDEMTGNNSRQQQLQKQQQQQANLESTKKIRSKANSSVNKTKSTDGRRLRKCEKGSKPKKYVDTSGKETDDDQSKTL